jgi:hypothetical protein
MIEYLQKSFFPVWIGFVSTEKEYDKELKRLGVVKTHEFISRQHSNATLHSLITPSGKYIMLMCIDAKKADKEKRCPNEVCGLMLHESVHVWQNVRDYIGEKQTVETEAYFIQDVCQFFIECFERSTGTKMKWGKK